MAGATSERSGLDDPAGSESAASLLGERLRPVDLLTTVAVPALLLVVFSLSESARLDFALAYLDPTIVTMYTAHFVHLDSGHLILNLAVYLAVVPVALALCTLAGRRRQFYATYVTVLIAFPFALSAMNILLVRPRIGFGFSGLNMAFLGFLPHALLGYLAERSERNLRPDHSPLLFFFGTAIIAFWAVPPTVASVLAGAVSLLASVVYLRSLSGDLSGSLGTAARHIAGEKAGMELVLAGICLFVLLPFTAFPHRPVAPGSVLNLFAHLLGFCFGYIVPYVTFRFATFDAVEA